MTDLATQIAEIVELSVEGRVEEALEKISRQYDIMQMEDQGWKLLYGDSSEKNQGLDLEALKKGSAILREAVAGSPLPKQANSLRYSYTFSQPFIIPGLLGSVEPTKGRGRPTAEEQSQKALVEFSKNDTAKRFFFGREAQELISTACSTDGHYFLLCDSKTKNVHAIPLDEIKTFYIDPDFPGEVWGYLREWSSYDPKKKTDVTKMMWYVTDRFPSNLKRPSSIEYGTDRVEVDQDKVMIDLRVGAQVGWTLGVPDLSAGEVWNRNYLNALRDGLQVSKTLAYYAAKIRDAKSPAAASSMGVSIAGGSGAGKTVIGQDVDVFSSAGKVYDYDGARPIAAMYALSAGVSVVDLLASPSAAGASYGSAAALAPGLRRAIEARRSQIAAWMERVLKWATGSDIQVTPASIEEVEPYRRTQILALALNSGLFHEDEIRPEFAYLAGVTLKHDTAPEGWLVPNNEKSLRRKDIDADGVGQNPTTASPGQGQSTGDGGAGSTAANDLRTDTVV